MDSKVYMIKLFILLLETMLNISRLSLIVNLLLLLLIYLLVLFYLLISLLSLVSYLQSLNSEIGILRLLNKCIMRVTEVKIIYELIELALNREML